MISRNFLTLERVYTRKITSSVPLAYKVYTRKIVRSLAKYWLRNLRHFFGRERGVQPVQPQKMIFLCSGIYVAAPVLMLPKLTHFNCPSTQSSWENPVIFVPNFNLHTPFPAVWWSDWSNSWHTRSYIGNIYAFKWDFQLQKHVKTYLTVKCCGS